MSEYQYYEFQAIDRLLSPEEIRVLRSHSSRARITPSSFVNEYSFGSFKGDEDEREERSARARRLDELSRRIPQTWNE